jgi:tetratricopeptide (TPR) repeat protein
MNHRRGIARTCSALLLLSGLLFCQACAPPPSPLKAPVVRKDPFQTVPQTLILKAGESEKVGDFPKALSYWHLVHAFRPHDPRVKAEMQRVSLRALEESRKHYTRAIEYSRQKKQHPAMEEFLLALYFNPNDHKSLHALCEDLFPTEVIVYHTKEGDTDRSIAKDIYHDPKKDFLVDYFSSSAGTTSLKPGVVLKLPIIELPPAIQKSHGMTSIQKARALLEKKEYKEAISLAEDIIAYGPSPAAREIINGSYYALALKEYQAGNLPEAEKLFTLVSRDFRQTADYIERIRNQLRVRADYHYKRGAHYFVDEKLKKAISEWEITLRLNPNHAKARADLKKARTMLNSLNGMQ